MKARLAFLTYDLPYPPNSGGKLRAYSLIKRLTPEFKIDLYSFYRRDQQLDHLDELKKICSAVKVYKRDYVWSPGYLFKALLSPLPLLNISYTNSKLEKDLMTGLEKKEYSLVHFEFLGTASLLPMVKAAGVKTVLGEENVEYQIYRNYSQKHRLSPLYPFFLYDVWKMKRFEEKLWGLSDLNLAVSSADAEVIEKVSGRCPVVVPNGVEVISRGLGHFQGSNSNQTAFFSGDLNYQQNRNGLAWFLSEVLPQIKKEIPNFRVLVLSRFRPRFINKYRADVKMVVDDESPFEKFVDDVNLFISPIIVKSGTNIKVLQAAANLLPIVGTPESFVGYDFENEKDVLMAGDSRGFGQKIIRLLKDEELRRRLAKNAFDKVQKYSWENSVKILKNVYRETLS